MDNLPIPISLIVISLIVIFLIVLPICYFALRMPAAHSKPSRPSRPSDPSDPSSRSKSNIIEIINIQALTTEIKNGFNKDDLKTLCSYDFDQFKYEEIINPNERLDVCVLNLVEFMQRHNLLAELIIALIKKRPERNWSSIIKK